MYDCAGFHHELRNRATSKSAVAFQSQATGRSAPGRPRLANWPGALAPLSQQLVPEGDAARERSVELALATTGRPFGDRKAMQAAASALAEHWAGLATELNAGGFNREAALRSLSLLTTPDRSMNIDFASARQIAWGTVQLSKAVSDKQPQSLLELQRRFALELPSGPNRQVMKNLPTWLRAAGEFDAEAFRQSLRQLRGELLEP
jgi:hypothetical protein